jgi:peptidyl-prolyl cis-trans isomerase B (cyclophilin B)
MRPRIERATGISTQKEVSPEIIKAYTTVGGAPTLDGAYTVFGKLVKGEDVLDKIATVGKGPGDRPLEDVRMTVTVEEMPKKKIEKLYGYKYPEK